MKLNIGSHNKRVKGFLNVDTLNLPEVDYICDITEIPWLFQSRKERDLFVHADDNSIDEILMVEVLEHISWRRTNAVLKECYRILKPGGKMHIQVPDCGSMMRAYCNNEISDEVSHKDPNDTIKRLNEGKSWLINPNRWLMAFCGAQKHPFDAHLNIFTQESLEGYLEQVGFRFEKIDDLLNWKLKYNCFKM